MSSRLMSVGALFLTGPFWLGGHLPAEELPLAQPSSLTFYVENDSFLGTDRYYTNGIRVTRGFEPDGLPRWAQKTHWMEPILDSLHLCPPGKSFDFCFNFETAWTFGQNLYTPDDIRTSRLLRAQRPYGAWLYYGNILTLSKPDLQHSLEIDAGAVGGNLALGGFVQSQWHAFLRSAQNSDTPPDPKGWGNQINNQLGLQLLYQGRRRWIEGKTSSNLRYFDLGPQANAALGTVNVNAGGGATVRFGYNVPNNFPDLSITIPFRAVPPSEPGEPQGLSLLDASAPSRSDDRWEAYVFARIDQRYVAYSAFLDGNLQVFGKSHFVTKEPLVRDLVLGAIVGHGHWRLSGTFVDRSPEFRGQRDHQQFLSFTVLHRS